MEKYLFLYTQVMHFVYLGLFTIRDSLFLFDQLLFHIGVLVKGALNNVNF